MSTLLHNSYRTLRDGSTAPYTLKYLMHQGLIGAPYQYVTVADFDIYNSGIVDVLLEYSDAYYYTIEAPEKLKHLIIENEIMEGDCISIIYNRLLGSFEVKKIG